MAKYTSTGSFLFLCVLVLLALAHATIGGRELPAVANSDHKKLQKECLGDQEGTVLIPGIGRYKLGSHEMPSVVGLDHSGPAAAHSHYIPGLDDTYVPNPGFEVPNPAATGGSSSTP